MLICLYQVEVMRSVSTASQGQVGLQEKCKKCGATEMQWRPHSWLWGRREHRMEKWYFWLTLGNGFCQVCEGHLDQRKSMSQSQRAGKCRRGYAGWLEYRAHGWEWAKGQQGPYGKNRLRWPHEEPWMLAWEICTNSSKILEAAPRI